MAGWEALQEWPNGRPKFPFFGGSSRNSEGCPKQEGPNLRLAQNVREDHLMAQGEMSTLKPEGSPWNTHCGPMGSSLYSGKPDHGWNSLLSNP